MKLTREIMEEIVRLRSRGVSLKEIAAEQNCSVSAIHRRADSMGIKLPKVRQPRKSKIVLPKSLDDLVYLAALIDCEGHIGCRPAQNNKQQMWYIGVTNTHVPTMEWLQAMGGSMNLKHSEIGLPCYGWLVSAQTEVFYTALAIRPHMRMKQFKADELIEDIRNRYEFAASYVEMAHETEPQAA